MDRCDIEEVFLKIFIIIFAMANKCFGLIPVELQARTFDIGLILIFLAILYHLVFRRQTIELFSIPLSWLLIVYLLFVLSQAALASMNYGQTIINGVIAVRHEFYYLSFFLFLMVLETPEQIVKFMNALSILALVVFALALVNYFGPRIMFSEFEGTVSTRGGIERAPIPAMSLITLAYLWNMTAWAYPGDRLVQKWSSFLAVVFLGAPFLRQGRFRIFTISLSTLWVLVKGKRFNVIAGIGALFLAASVIASFTMETNIFVDVFVSGVEDATKVSGTAEDRVHMIELDLAVFREYPLMGSGLAAVRVNEENEARFIDLTRKMDLGYPHWLKFYGIAGMLWIAVFYLSLYIYYRKLVELAPPNFEVLPMFSSSYLIFLVVAFVSLNYFMFPDGVLTICLLCAILVRGTRPGFFSQRPVSAKGNLIKEVV